jgi:hypothetical protein
MLKLCKPWSGRQIYRSPVFQFPSFRANVCDGSTLSAITNITFVWDFCLFHLCLFLLPPIHPTSPEPLAPTFRAMIIRTTSTSTVFFRASICVFPFICHHAFLDFLRLIPASPSNPVPNRSRVVGSGTGEIFVIVRPDLTSE